MGRRFAGTEFIPVSYTHLDVYKRQTLLSARISGAEGALSSVSSRLFPFMLMPYLQSLSTAAVSYTHLDVYKRQGMNPAVKNRGF